MMFPATLAVVDVFSRSISITLTALTVTSTRTEVRFSADVIELDRCMMSLCGISKSDNVYKAVSTRVMLSMICMYRMSILFVLEEFGFFMLTSTGLSLM